MGARTNLALVLDTGSPEKLNNVITSRKSALQKITENNVLRFVLSKVSK